MQSGTYITRQIGLLDTETERHTARRPLPTVKREQQQHPDFRRGTNFWRAVFVQTRRTTRRERASNRASNKLRVASARARAPRPQKTHAKCRGTSNPRSRACRVGRQSVAADASSSYTTAPQCIHPTAAAAGAAAAESSTDGSPPFKRFF